MGALCSCLRGERYVVLDGDHDYETVEILPAVQGGTNSVFLGSDVRTPESVVKTSDMKMVAITDSSSGSFDEDLVNKLIDAAEDPSQPE